jgi:hypothetical protein
LYGAFGGSGVGTGLGFGGSGSAAGVGPNPGVGLAADCGLLHAEFGCFRIAFTLPIAM